MDVNTEKNVKDDNKWTKIDKDTLVNDSFLSGWTNAGLDDGFINKFLKKRFLKERSSYVFFGFFVIICCLLVILKSFMLDDDLPMAVIFIVIACFAQYFIYSEMNAIKILRKTIDSQNYQITIGTASDIDVKGVQKACIFTDKAGTTLLKKTEKSDPVPMKIVYHGYFTFNDNEALLLRVKGLRDFTIFYVFPIYYLRNLDKRKRKDI